ncbi:hypothetical protein KJ359_009146 [Pestalotiopsis sp. 9143b]|nr:hypothetical protein KJ359_009146 [Pestalotiopsis sp. 9143b]
MARLNPLDYKIALITVLEIETQAALLMLDHRHEGEFPLKRGDDYVFHAGDINGRNVVIATFPAGSHHGTGVAASLASQTKSYFRNLWFGLLIGVAAGLPNHSKTPAVDIRLGDVLVALPKGESAGLISYDLGKTTDGNFELIDGGRALAKTEAVVRSAIGAIKINGPNGRRLFLPFYEAMKDEQHSFKHSVNKTFRDPGQDEDRLYATGPDGVEILVERARRPDDKRTRVWYGPIGSGDKLIKSSAERDRLRDSYNIIGLEMGAAGVMSNLPVGVIRGVCNYGDKHKNKQWQPYAAAMAASYAKAILIKVGEGDEVRVAHGSSNRNITKKKFDVDIIYLAIPNINLECEILCDLPSQTDQFFGREAQFGMMKQSLQGTDVVWIDAASPQTIDQSISQCADRIRLRYPQLQQTSVGVSHRMIVLEWLLKRNALRKWLVVIDGMDDLLTSRTLFQSFENVLSDSGAILITSTNPNMARVCRLAQITVEDLDIGSACSLILWRAMGITESDDKKELLRGMAKCLQRLGRLEETRNTLEDAEDLAIYVYGLSSDEAADIYFELKNIKERIRVQDAHQQSALIATTGPKLERRSREIDESNLTATEQLADTRWETSSEFSTVDSSNCGSTPLYLTSSRGHLTMIELLLEGGASQGLVTKEGETPLLQAAKNNQPSAVSLLLEKDASYINATDAKGRTPLSKAAKYGSPELRSAMM